LTNTIADCSIYTANQPIYAATPIFKDGRTDPVARRSGIVEGRPAVSPPNNIKTMKPHEPRGVSGGVMFNANDAIMAGRHLLQRTLAIDEWKHPRWCPPTPTGARAYKLAERLKDFALSEQQIVDLLIETIPSFDQEARPRIEAMVESAFLHGQNDPGCGSPNNAVFSEIIYGWEAKIEENKEFWDRIIEASQGAISRLPTPRVASRKFPREFTKKARQIIAEDRAEWAQTVKRGAK